MIALSSIVGVLALLLASSLSSVKADETPEPPRTLATYTATPKATDKPTLTPTTLPTHTALPTNTPTSTSTSTPTEIPTPTPSPMPTLNPFEGIVRVAQTQAGLTIVGGAVCLVVLIALLGLLILFWLRGKRTAPPLALVAPFLELESTGLRLYLKRDALTLGRASDCDLRIAENLPGADTVSHQHARFVKRDARWVAVDGVADDQPSTNGVYVNGKRTLENYLSEGDEVAFGELKSRFHLPTSGITDSQGDAR